MKCKDYRELAAAHVDGELAGDELHAAQAHLRDCPSCDDLRRAQGEVRELLRGRRPHPTPDLLRASIKRRMGSKVTRSRIIVAGAIAATLLLGLVPLFRSAPSGVIPQLAADVSHGEATAPEVETGEVAVLRSYYASKGLTFENAVDDLRPFGLELVGGSVSRLGAIPTTLTVYQTDAGKVVCRRFPARGFPWPAGGRPLGDSRVFSHDGIHVALTKLSGDIICAMTSRIPPDRFLTPIHAGRMRGD